MTKTSVVGCQLDDFRALIEERSGIHFDSSRERFFTSRLFDHMQERGITSGADLMPLVLSSNVEYEALLQRVLTQETSFFRYPSAFEALKRIVLPEIHAKRLWDKPRTLRIWSAGCSTGEEPYSAAIALAESPAFAAGWNTEILATDISRQAIARAVQGVYPRRAIANLSPALITEYFKPVNGQFEVKPVVRNKVAFVVMNLVRGLYLGRMDCIFCMNVLIYFSDEQRDLVIRNFYDCLEPGGYLMLGHSETLGASQTRFEKLVFQDCLLYRKPGAESAASPSGRNQ